MQQIVLPRINFLISRFVFGTGSLFNAGRSVERQRVLDAAYDHGFSHFDTAPYYGFGAAERDLRSLLGRHRNATVTTKVGIYSPGGEDQSDSSVFARKAAGRFLKNVSRPTHDWTIARARGSLDASLRRLGREKIDLYLLHEPDFHALTADEWTRWLEDEVTAGRVGHFGIAVDEKRLAPFLVEPNGLTGLIQTVDSIGAREADQLLNAKLPLQITYGYVSDALKRTPGSNVRNILSDAMQRNKTGAIIVSTRKPARMKQYAELSAAS